jgi:cation:H+ antiporter
MVFTGIELLFMLLLILVASQLFTNALEYFSHSTGLSAGFAGSILAAVATAMPEATVPVIALLAGSSDFVVNEEISVGAILGAPLMLSTLSTFMMAAAALPKRSLSGHINPERRGFLRDLHFSLLAFAIGGGALFLPIADKGWRFGVSGLLVALYLTYVYQTFKASKGLVAEGHGVIPDEPLLLTKLGLPTHRLTIYLQMLLGLVVLIIGAKGFIHGVEATSRLLQISALLISLLIIPIATELPEKVNSILWIRKRKDTLAFGNITGAMVFQGTLLPALGVTLAAWQPNRLMMTGMIVTFVATAWLRFNVGTRGLRVWALMVSGLFYLTYLFLVLGR